MLHGTLSSRKLSEPQMLKQDYISMLQWHALLISLGLTFNKFLRSWKKQPLSHGALSRLCWMLTRMHGAIGGKDQSKSPIMRIGIKMYWGLYMSIVTTVGVQRFIPNIYVDRKSTRLNSSHLGI